MAKLLKLRRGTTTQHASFTGAEGEVTIDTDKDTAVVHDGSTQAGRPLAREDMTNVSSASIAGRLGTDSIATTKIAAGALPTDVTVADANISGNLTIESADIVDGTIVNADVNASAAIAGTKIAPSFGAQDIVGQKLEIAHATPTIELNDADSNDWSIINNNGTIGLYDQTNGGYRLTIGSDGHVVIAEDKKLSLHTYADIRTKTGSTTHVTQDSLVLDADHDIWLATSGNKITFGTSDSADHEVMRVQCAAVGASQHGYVNLNYVTANAGGSASSATKLQTTSTGVSVTGNVAATGDILISSATPKISLTDTDSNSDFDILNTNGTFQVNDTTNGAVRFSIMSNGQVDFSGNVDCNAGLDVTGNITVSGTSTISGDATFSGDAIFNGGGGAAYIGANSDIRFADGTWTGETAGKIQQNSNTLYIQGGSSGHQFRNNSGTAVLTLDTSGNLVATGNVTAYSDARLKTDIHTINDALGICGKLRGVSYKWIQDGKESIGVIAQEVEEVIPEVVLTSVNTDPATGETTEVKSVDYGKIVGVLINAVNELKAEVDELKGGK